MGMFDDIHTCGINIKCGKCGCKLDGWQSKDGPCELRTLPFYEVDNFYTMCYHCGAWHEFERKKCLTESIDDYELIIGNVKYGD